ncbi:hypothetical protein N0021_15730, partial [Pseudomonas aeruginosa]|nr:hypothetical protein [Pseudomonas aeruginosa]
RRPWLCGMMLQFQFNDRVALSSCNRQVMSAHECVVAGCRDLFVGDVGLGFSEIWIPGVEKGAYFASPSLILHYIEEHDYCPPQMYSEAVMAVDLEVGYKAQEVYVGLVAGHF